MNILTFIVQIQPILFVAVVAFRGFKQVRHIKRQLRIYKDPQSLLKKSYSDPFSKALAHTFARGRYWNRLPEIPPRFYWEYKNSLGWYFLKDHKDKGMLIFSLSEHEVPRMTPEEFQIRVDRRLECVSKW